MEGEGGSSSRAAEEPASDTKRCLERDLNVAEDGEFHFPDLYTEGGISLL